MNDLIQTMKWVNDTKQLFKSYDDIIKRTNNTVNQSIKSLKRLKTLDLSLNSKSIKKSINEINSSISNISTKSTGSVKEMSTNIKNSNTKSAESFTELSNKTSTATTEITSSIDKMKASLNKEKSIGNKLEALNITNFSNNLKTMESQVKSTTSNISVSFDKLPTHVQRASTDLSNNNNRIKQSITQMLNPVNLMKSAFNVTTFPISSAMTLLKKSTDSTKEGFKQLNNISQQYKKSMSDIKSVTSSSNNALSGMVRNVLSLATAYVSVSSAVNVFKGAVDRVDTIKSATMSIEQLTGSSEKASKVMADLTEIVQGTPISLNQLSDSAKGLIASGMATEQVADVLRAVGDASFSVGKGAESIDIVASAFKSLQSSGVASLGDLNRLLDQNIPVYQILGNQLNMTVTDMKKMISDGILPSTDAIKLLTDGIENGTSGINGSTAEMAGQMISAGNTIKGTLANIKTAFVQSIAPIIDKYYPQIVAGLTAFKDKIKEFQPIIIEFFDNIIIKATETTTKIMEFISSFDFSGVFEHLTNFKDLIAEIFPLILGGFVAIKALNIVTTIITSISTISASISALWGVILANPIGLAIAAIVALFAYFYTTSEEIRNKTNAVFSAIKNTIVGVFDTIKGIYEEHKETIDTIFNTIYTVIEAVFSGILDVILNAVTTMNVFYEEYIKKFADKIMEIFTEIGNVIKKVMGKSSKDVEKSSKEMGIFAKTWEIIQDIFMDIFNTIVSFFENSLDHIVDAMDIGLRLLKGDWAGAWNSMLKTVFNFINRTISTIKNSGLGKWFEKTFNVELKTNYGESFVDGLADVEEEKRVKREKKVRKKNDALSKKGKKGSSLFDDLFNKKKNSALETGTSDGKDYAKGVDKAGLSKMATSKADGKANNTAIKEAEKQRKKEESERKKALKETEKQRKKELAELNKKKSLLKKTYDSINKVNSDYLKKSKDINNKLATDIKNTKDSYLNSVSSLADSLYNKTGLFDRVSTKMFDKLGLQRNLDSQIKQFEDWQKTINSISKKVPKDIHEELRKMGVDSLGELKAINSMSTKELDKYVKSMYKKQDITQKEAVFQSKDEKKIMEQEIKTLTNSAVKELQNAQKDWVKELNKYKADVKTLKGFSDNGKQIGSEMGNGLIKGLESMNKQVSSSSTKLANSALNTLKKVLDIHSPSKETEKFGQYFGEGFKNGIENMMKETYNLINKYGNEALNHMNISYRMEDNDVRLNRRVAENRKNESAFTSLNDENRLIINSPDVYMDTVKVSKEINKVDKSRDIRGKVFLPQK